MWGAFTSVMLWLGTFLFLVIELGDPTSNWSVPVLSCVAVTLTLATYTTRAKGVCAGTACGLAFSIPIALDCYWVAHFNSVIVREHGGQLMASGLTVIVLATLIMGAVARSRKSVSTPIDNPNWADPIS